MTGKLEAVSESLAQYDAMIDTFIDGNKALSQVSKETGEALKDGQDKLANGTDRLEESKMICSPPDNLSTALAQISHRH